MLIHNVFQHILFIKLYFHMDSQSATPNPYTTPYMKHIPVALWPSMLSCEKGENIFFIQCWVLSSTPVTYEERRRCFMLISF